MIEVGELEYEYRTHELNTIMEEQGAPSVGCGSPTTAPRRRSRSPEYPQSTSGIDATAVGGGQLP